MAGPRSKIVRSIETYELAGLGEQLAAEWTSDENRASLRELADRFNKAVLRAAIEPAGSTVQEEDIDRYYRALTDEQAGSGEEIRARRDLERAGVDVDTVQEDFVSHQAVHNFLQSEQGVTYDAETDTVAARTETLRRLQGRVRAVAESAIETLGNAGKVSVGDVTVYVDIRVYCADCGTERSIFELIEGGGCECAE